ncbi:MAG: RNA-binding transcriptional accessory protein [Bacteroidetes bacterium]|nr:MAG: RNA-binding transcriptional accessory protein [Bacteroidota bacterium]
MNNTERISRDLAIKNHQVDSVLELFKEGATIPFVARYRKEQTGGLDEIALEAIQKSEQYYIDLSKRKEFILSSINEQNKLDDQLKERIENCWDIKELEDLYLPYKSKRKTKADDARAKGLEPLAGRLMKEDLNDAESFAQQFVTGTVASADEALQGARDIMAEWMAEGPQLRKSLRNLFQRKAILETKETKTEHADREKFRDYFNYQQESSRIPSHRMLALLRADKEKIIRITCRPEEEDALFLMERLLIQANNEASKQKYLALEDAYKRLLRPSLENELLKDLKQKADKEAIAVFAKNLEQLLMSSPLGAKRILGIDPGFRTGCKTVCLSEQGDLLHNETIFPHASSASERSKAMSKVSQLVEAYKIDAIAVGNGTAGRETEEFLEQIQYRRKVSIYSVNEAGASIYSASPIAREEFPNYDITVRGAVSIGRRLMDPLAELVKIDPKSIGVGQYQHDIGQKELQESLDNTVMRVVNQVGVDLNTASSHLLQYISGLGKKLAEEIISHRQAIGGFKKRSELMKVKGLGAKAFEQSAGFLRITQAENPLDSTAVHPESYPIVKSMSQSLKLSLEELIKSKEQLEKIKAKDYINSSFGEVSVQAILEELKKVGRDIRGAVKAFSFDPRLRKIEDVQVGMILPGIVSNITNFGAFVDIGVKQDGLVHVSQLANRFVKDPLEVVQLQEQVRVKVLEVDANKKRIQLSIKLAE